MPDAIPQCAFCEKTQGPFWMTKEGRLVCGPCRSVREVTVVDQRQFVPAHNVRPGG